MGLLTLHETAYFHLLSDPAKRSQGVQTPIQKVLLEDIRKTRVWTKYHLKPLSRHLVRPHEV